jgi:hypothetical protein
LQDPAGRDEPALDGGVDHPGEAPDEGVPGAPLARGQGRDESEVLGVLGRVLGGGFGLGPPRHLGQLRRFGALFQQAFKSGLADRPINREGM